MVKAIQYILGVILLLLVIIMTVYYHHFSITQTEEEQSMKHSILQSNDKYKQHIPKTNITTTSDLKALRAYIKQQDYEIIALKTQLQQLQQQKQTENDKNNNLHMPTESSSSSSYIVPRQYSLEAPPSTLQQVLSSILTLSLYNITFMSYHTTTHNPPLYNNNRSVKLAMV